MLRLARTCWGLLAATALAGIAHGQEPRRGQFADLVGHPEVRREIGLTPVQEAKLDAVAARLKKEKPAHPQARAEIAKVLKPDQVKRLEQVRLQVQDGLALEDAEVVKALGLDATARRRLEAAHKLNAQEEAKMADTLKRARFRTAEDRNAFVAKVHKASSERLLGVLDASQKAKFEEMKGKALADPKALP